LPEGQPVKVVGTDEQQIYFANHQMSVFDKKSPMPIHGRVIDLDDNLIKDPATPMEVILS